MVDSMVSNDSQGGDESTLLTREPFRAIPI